MEQTILQIQDLLTNNEVEPALHKLRSIFSLAGSDLVNDAVLLSGQIKKLQSDVRKGILDYSQETLAHNRLLNATVSLLDELRQAPDKFAAFVATEQQLDISVRQRGAELLSADIKDVLFERMAAVKEKNLDLRILWVDDSPSNNRYESRLLESIGLRTDYAESSTAARQLLETNNYTLILSDISRNGVSDEGFRFLRELIEQGIDLPTIFYTARVHRNRGVPPFAFGIAAMPNDLLHLVLDVLARKY
ncbi:MAG: response regulator [Bacteroidetes bacterium]|nr:MAG: response regulator [Bacteroidota bacterium]